MNQQICYLEDKGVGRPITGIEHKADQGNRSACRASMTAEHKGAECVPVPDSPQEAKLIQVAKIIEYKRTG
ncbi:hypothetical protein GCM10027567_06760 [Spongiibacter taiwanensis]